MRAIIYVLISLVALGLIIYVIYGFLIMTGPRM